MARAPTPFPRGIADPDKARAYLRALVDALLAIELTNGKVVWRTSAALRPLAVVENVLVAMRVAAEHAIDFELLDEASGKTLRVSAPLALPEWVRPSLDDTADFTLRAEIEARAAIVRWTARARYRGGAPPSAKVRADHARDAQGAARVHIDTGAIEPLPVSADAEAFIAQQHASASAPDVLEQCVLGERCFQLITRAGASGMTEIIVRAVDGATGRTAWETVVDAVMPQRPRPPRP